MNNSTIMPTDHSNKNLQKASFANKDLSLANFAGSDLRGADFSGANLTGADFTKARTGLTPGNVALIFLASLTVSLFSGYIAMLAGHTIQQMLASKDQNVRTAGIATGIITLVFIGYYFWKGGSNAIRSFLLPAMVVAFIIGIVAFVSGAGTGMGMLYQVLALLFVGVMFIVGIISRAAAGTLSSTIIFLVVALGGGMFGKSIGGGIGTVVMALSCAQISKKALSGAAGFETARKIAIAITAKLGTSFRKARLGRANFLQAKIHNADFTGANLESVNWGDSKKINCINSEGKFTAK